MTLSDLNLHLDMVTQLNDARDRLQSMTSFLQAQNLDGMPRGSGERRKVERLAVLIDQQKQEVERMDKMVKRSEPAIREYIETIEDNRTSQIFSLHFLCGFSWPEVAEVIGGRNTAEAVKSVCYRYLRVDGWV